MQIRDFVRIACFAAGLSATIAVAQNSVRDHDITSDDYFTIGVINECAVSPDGQLVAYVELRWVKDLDKRNADIWVADRRSRETRRLTFDPAPDNAIQWSADGRWIYFTSARKSAGEDAPPLDGAPQVWRIGADGMGLTAVTRVKKGIQAFELSADGATLYYTVGHEKVDDEWKDLREKHKDLKYGHGVVTYSQMWKLDLRNWREEKLIDELRVIGDFTVTPDGRRIAMLTTPKEELIANEGRSTVDVYDAQSKTITRLNDTMWRDEAPSPHGWLESLAWSHDGNALAFGIGFDGYPAEVFVAHFSDTGQTIQKLTRKDEISIEPGNGLQWRGKSMDLLVRAEYQARARVYCIKDIRGGRQGDTIEVTGGDVSVDKFDALGDGSGVAVVMSTTTHPPDVYFATLEGAPQPGTRITNVNPQVDTWKLPSIQLVQWTSADGTPVEGILELPPDHVPGKPLPMVVELHGGPTASTLLPLQFWIYGRVLMPAKGYALLSPNYRGSTGYGDKFLTELIGHENDRDVADILAGVDAMVERGIADPERLGVMGWSNGGFLTNCVITKTTRFKAASSGAGVLDMVMQWGMEDTPGHVINFQQGLPWTNEAEMRAASPLYDADKIVTPTLIHVGGDDPRCPPGHSKALHRALHEYLQVPAELVIYPGAGHGLTTYKHRQAKMEWDIAWFDRYLLNNEKEDGQTAPTTVTGEAERVSGAGDY